MSISSIGNSTYFPSAAIQAGGVNIRDIQAIQPTKTAEGTKQSTASKALDALDKASSPSTPTPTRGSTDSERVVYGIPRAGSTFNASNELKGRNLDTKA